MLPFSLQSIPKGLLIACALLLAWVPGVEAAELQKLLEKGLAEGITIDLKNPSYCHGVLSTDEGGVITAPGLRIQALHLRYTHLSEEDPVQMTIEAEGDLIFECGDYLFVGDKLFYDFQKQEGVITNGKTALPPWFFGGETIEIRPDGSYVVNNGYVTTSEHDRPEWGIYSKVLSITEENNLFATQVELKLFNYPLLWVPSLRTQLDSIFDFPLRYRFRWGGRQGPRVGFNYEIFSWNRWKTSVRFDYRLTRGPGGGLETSYHSEDDNTLFQSIYYLAKDSSILHPDEKARYRFEGIFRKLIPENRTHFLLTWDKISDKNMPSSYYDRDFDFDTSQRTQLLVRHREDRWISHFYMRGRVNSFQTVKEELPTLKVGFKPFELPHSGIIAENWASASYLDFKYSEHLCRVHNYSSSRFDYRPTLYRPFVFGSFFTATPELGAIAITYGDSPCEGNQSLIMGKVGCQLRSQLYRYYRSFKHVVAPYAYYRYYSSPTSSPHQHFIFDIEDGWTRLNYLQIGINQALYYKGEEGKPRSLLTADLYTYAFFDTRKIPQPIPRIYGRFIFFPFLTMKHIIDTAWNLEHGQLDHFNFRIEWTLHANLAFTLEYRHRGRYSWRKVDENNFFVDVFHREKCLLHSQLSERRDTLLFHAFYRFHPNWAVDISSRQGWHHLRQPAYFEYEIDLLTTFQTAWHVRFSFQRQENDTRFATYVTVGL